MISSSQEDRIRRRAYEIWEREGRPEGRHDVHWAQAVQEIRAEDGWVDDAADPASPADDPRFQTDFAAHQARSGEPQ